MTIGVVKWIFKAIVVAAVAGAIWYGIDSVAAAFRDRKQLRYDLDRETTHAEQARQAQAIAVAHASLLDQRNKAELLLRDALSKAAAKRALTIQKELDHAKNRLSQWQSTADPDLARCLRMPLPRWLLDGSAPPGPPIEPPGLLPAGPAAGRTPQD